MQPGQVTVPHGSDEPKQPGVGAPPEPTRPLEEPGPDPTPAPTPVPAPEPATVSPVATEAPQAEQPAPDVGWKFSTTPDPSQRKQSEIPEDISWTASEFIAREKGIGWFGMLIVIGLAAAAADYFLMHDVFSTGIIVFVTVFFALFAARKPREQNYALTRQGVHIGAKTYGFNEFKNFSIIEDGSTISVVFMPLKRFMPALTIYVIPDVEERVLNFLSPILPFEQHKADMVDSLMRRIGL